MKNLSNTELLEINGGGYSNNSGISVSSSTESLLTLRFEHSSGGRENVTEISVGNNINLNLLVFGIGNQ